MIKDLLCARSYRQQRLSAAKDEGGARLRPQTFDFSALLQPCRLSGRCSQIKTLKAILQHLRLN